MNYRYVTPQELYDDTYSLGEQIKAAHINIQLIVAIARGGLTPAQIISDTLSVPVASFTIQSYHGQHQEKNLHLRYGLTGDLGGKHILIVDDLADSGRTFVYARAYLESFHPGRITTAALYQKPTSTYAPDFSLRHTDAWLIFPHEVCETFDTFCQMYGPEEASALATKVGLPLLH